MGCSSGREVLKSEEASLRVFEQNLEYCNTNASCIDMLFRKYSCGETINAHQWDDIIKSLNIHAHDTKECPMRSQFYEKFRNQNGSYDRKPLLILGIMLSTGTPALKSQLLFEIFDENDTRVLSKNSVEELFDIMFDLSLEHLPSLAVKTIFSFEGKDVSRNYIEKLKNGRSAAKTLILGKFFKHSKSSIKIETFKKKFEDCQISRLLTPSGLRRFINDSIQTERKEDVVKINSE